MKEKIFYYHFDWLNGWFIFNAVLLIMVIGCGISCPCMFLFPQTFVIIGVLSVSIALWTYKHFYPIQAILINDDGIKIDHNNLLLWKDIASARRQDVLCCFKKRRILALQIKEGVDYKYTFLQKHNCFPPFSVPLYGILKSEDEQEIQKIIAKKVHIDK